MAVNEMECLIDGLGDGAMLFFMSNSQTSLCAVCGNQFLEPVIIGFLNGHQVVYGGVFDVIKRIGGPHVCMYCLNESEYVYLKCSKYRAETLDDGESDE